MSNVNQISGYGGTPGPWIVYSHCCTLYIGHAETSGYVNAACTIDVSPGLKQEIRDRAQRNAVLIAAAPEMLEALRAIRQYVPSKYTHLRHICNDVIAKVMQASPIEHRNPNVPSETQGIATGLLGGSTNLAKYFLSAVAGGHIPDNEETKPFIDEAKALVYTSTVQS